MTSLEFVALALWILWAIVLFIAGCLIVYYAKNIQKYDISLKERKPYWGRSNWLLWYAKNPVYLLQIRFGGIVLIVVAILLCVVWMRKGMK